MKQITARKIFALLLSFVGILFLATSCAKSNAKHESYGSSKETGTEILSAAGLSEYEIEKYFDSFADSFLPDDYLRLYELAERESATPQRCLSHSLFLAEQDFSTYNSKNKKGVLMDGQRYVEIHNLSNKRLVPELKVIYLAKLMFFYILVCLLRDGEIEAINCRSAQNCHH